MPRIERPSQPPPTTNDHLKSWFSVLAVLIVGVVLLLVGSRLLLAVLGVGMGPMLVIMGIFALAGLHYVIWGHWLGAMIRQEEQQQAVQEDTKNGKS